MKNILFYIIVFLLIVSCSKEVIIDVIPHDSSIVVNCFIKPESKIQLNISKSSGIFDTSNNVVSDLKILLFENNLLIDTFMNLDSGNYISNIYPSYGSIYKISTKYNGEIILASDYLPHNFKFLNIVDSDKIYSDAEGSEYTGVKINILDNKETLNYYSVKIIFKNEYHESSLHIFSYDQIIKSEEIESYNPHELIFSNALFKEDTTELFVNYYVPTRSSHKIIVQVKKTSYAYYLYKKQLIKHLYNQDGDVWDGVGDPVQMYTNIEGGYGIFAGYTQITDTIYE